MSLLSQLAAGLAWVLYGSFFEWFWHKCWMHTPRPPRIAFEGHTLTHHVLYKGDESYFVDEEDNPHHILLKWYSLPAIVAAHLPVMYLIDRYVVHHTMIGGLVAVTVYFAVYEYAHWNMHVPRGRFVERFRAFQFLRRHHKLHHQYMQSNFCVLFPLADVVMGTLITDASLARRRLEREAAIETGIPLAGRRKPGIRRARNSPAARAAKRGERRKEAGPAGPPPGIRETLHVGADRRDK
jgi:hypothetical protein